MIFSQKKKNLMKKSIRNSDAQKGAYFQFYLQENNAYSIVLILCVIH